MTEGDSMAGIWNHVEMPSPMSGSSWRLLTMSSGGAVGYSPGFMRPGLPHSMAASGCSELLQRQLQAPTAGDSTQCREKLRYRLSPLLGSPDVTSATFCWFASRPKPVSSRGEKKERKDIDSFFNRRSVNDFCGHCFKPSKSRSDTFKVSLRAILLQWCIFTTCDILGIIFNGKTFQWNKIKKDEVPRKGL